MRRKREGRKTHLFGVHVQLRSSRGGRRRKVDKENNKGNKKQKRTTRHTHINTTTQHTGEQEDNVQSHGAS